MGITCTIYNIFLILSLQVQSSEFFEITHSYSAFFTTVIPRLDIEAVSIGLSAAYKTHFMGNELLLVNLCLAKC